MVILDCLSNDTKVEFDNILQESMFQSVFPIAYKELSQTSASELNVKWEKEYYRILRHNVLNRESHRELHIMMQEAGLPYVIIKGMASAKYYQDPLLRTMGDVDFLVHKDHVGTASYILEKNGFIKEPNDEHGFHQVFKKNSMIWELHWLVPGIPREGVCGDNARMHLNGIIEKAEFYDGYMVPCDYHHGIVLLLHSASHMTTTGMGLRHLCDWAVFVDRFNDDEFCQMFEKTLKEIGLWEYARILTAISSKKLGIEEKKWAKDIDAETIDLIFKDIYTSGNFGTKDHQRINQAKLMRDDKTRTITGGRIGYTLLRNINVRSYRALPITKRVPLLLPIGWIYLCARHFFRIAKGERTKISIIKTISGANERSKIYQRLKLFENEAV